MADGTDSDRLETVFREHYPAVLAYARRRLAGSVADDVAAETFAIAWRKADAIPEEPLPWLLGVARRVLATHRRSLRRRQRLEQKLQAVAVAEPDPPAPERTSFDESAVARPPGMAASGPPALEGRLGDALAALSETDREAILLIAWEGLTSNDAATALGMTTTAFAVRLHRARRRLRIQLERAADRTPALPVDRRPPLQDLSATKGAP